MAPKLVVDNEPTEDDDDLLGPKLSLQNAGRQITAGDNYTGGSGTAASRQLQSFIERVERLNEEKKGISDDISEVFAEAKGQGFDTKVMRKVIAIRKIDPAVRQEEEALLDLYLHALGMIRE